MAGGGVNKALRFAVLVRDNFTCHYCGRYAPNVELEVDHIHPRSRGGGDEMENLTTACHDCNQGKKHWMIPRRALLRLSLPDPDQVGEEETLKFVLAEDLFEGHLMAAYRRGVEDQMLKEEVEPRPGSGWHSIKEIMFGVVNDIEQVP